MVDSIRHLALFVPDLQGAEVYYCHLFDMELVSPEALLEQGLWCTLPAARGWEDARASGIELDMVALRRGAFVLALFPGDPQPGQLYPIGLSMPLDAIARVRERLPADAEVVEDRAGALQKILEVSASIALTS